MRAALRRLPGARVLARRLSPARRAEERSWRRVQAAVPGDVVSGGPFQGMRLGPNTTGSHLPKRLGSYEAELHPLVRSWPEYDRVLDIGCGEGWYVVGLARRMPHAQIFGFDTSAAARRACRRAAELNAVSVHVGGAATPETLQSMIGGRCLVIMDIEGAEDELCDPQRCPALREADLLVEAHDFLRPGVSDRLRARFPERTPVRFPRAARDPARYPALAGLAAADRARAVDEARPADQQWWWLPRP